MERLNIIINKFRKLKQLDKNFCVFGSEMHEYKFNSPLSKSSLQKFEYINNIKLPNEYTEFLLKIGNGGAGPHCGLMGISTKKYKRFSNKFRFISDFTPLTYDNCTRIDEDSLDCEDCSERFTCVDAYYEDDNEYKYDYISGYLDGSYLISNYGCGSDIRIVLNGPETGNIWYNYPEQIFTPLKGINKDRLSFYDWYENWLDSNLNKFEFVENAIRRKADYSEFFVSQYHNPYSEILATYMGISLIREGKISHWDRKKLHLHELDINLEEEYDKFLKDM